MNLLHSIIIAISTYTAIPMPQVDWTEDSTRYALCFFPVTGCIVAAAMLLWRWLCMSIGAGEMLFACGATILPLLVTGGIHMDGYCDAVDALASRQDRERKLEIMKDPNTGAFAVIYFGVYMLAAFGLMSELYRTAAYTVVCVGYVLSRSLSALAALTLKGARTNGMLASFANGKPVRAIIPALFGIAAIAVMIILDTISGSAAAAAALLWLMAYRHIAYKHFGGVTGDTAGFFLQLCELLMLAAAYAAVVAGRM